MNTGVRLLGMCGILVGGLAFAQAPVTGLSGVGGQGGQGGLFTIPRVEAHTLGIPGVTRPMLMAGPAGGFGGGMGGGLGGGGGMGSGMMVNPNWVGAAGMFMPQLLTGGANGNVGSGTATGGGTATRTFGANGTASPWTVVGAGPAREAGVVDATAQRASVASAQPSRPVTPQAAKVDPEVAEARLLDFQKEQARQGSPSAQLALARRYATGRGVEANAAVAQVWLEAAARNGSEEARRELEKAGTLVKSE